MIFMQSFDLSDRRNGFGFPVERAPQSLQVMS
jgi:hypothetical protein